MYFHSRGMVLQQKGMRHEAIKEFDKALGLNSNQVPSRYHLGLMYRAIGEYEKALKAFTEVLAIDKSDRRVYESRALVHRDMKNFKASVEDYTSAIELEGDYPDNYFARG